MRSTSVPPRINRAAQTLEVGEAIREIARRLGSIDQFAGDARVRELRQIQMQLSPLSSRLKVVIDNCRAAGGSYPNYPAVRKAIQDGGEQVYTLRVEFEEAIAAFGSAITSDPYEDNFSRFIPLFAKIGQQLKLVQFAPPLASEPQPSVQ